MSLMSSYDKRVQYVSSKIGQDLAEAFLEKLKDGVPSGDEYKAYVESLSIVQVTGARERAVFAVVSDKTKVRMRDITGSKQSGKTVVYFYSSNQEETSELVVLLEQGNPWPADMVPHGVPKKDVTLLHKIVSEGEMEWARENAKRIISANKHTFRRNGIYWGNVSKEEEDAGALESLPDFMSLAIRAEFGINTEMKSHWRPAAKWVLNNAVSIVKKDDRIKSALHDSLFREHTLHRGVQYKPMDEKEFNKEAGKFQRKVVR